MPILILRSIMPGTVGNNLLPSQVGHAWIEISGSLNSPTGGDESYGYYPEKTSPYYFGEVKTGDRENYLGIGEGRIFHITEEQAQAFRDYAKIADHGFY